jgi:hypothetical protein
MEPYNPPSILARPPPAVPIAESENTDVIALRSALSILQMQKQTATRDIRMLDRMRQTALEDPEGYVKALLERVNSNQSQTVGGGANGLLDDTVKRIVEGLWAKGMDHDEALKHVRAAFGASENDVQMTGTEEEDDEAANDDESESDSDGDETTSKTKDEKFQPPPKAQNVFRMPPINWSKYAVVGDALDRIHEGEKRRPTLGEPHTNLDAGGTGVGVPEEYAMAAPYHPVLDKARLSNGDGYSPNIGPSGDHPMQTRRAARRHFG